MEFLVALGLSAIICGFIGRAIGEGKGRPEAGFIFGALLGPIGILIIAVGPDIRAEQAALRARKCPACKGSVPEDARKCMHCGEDLAVQPMTTTLSSSNVRYYYSTNGEQLGPVDASDLRMMRKDGLISDDTPVFREGEAEWRSFRDYLALNR